MAIVRQRTPELLKKYEKYQIEVADGLLGSVGRANPTNNNRDFRMLNPDQLTFDSDRDADRWVYFSTAPPKVNFSHYDRVNNRWTFVSRTQDTKSTTQLRIPSAPMSPVRAIFIAPCAGQPVLFGLRRRPRLRSERRCQPDGHNTRSGDARLLRDRRLRRHAIHAECVRNSNRWNQIAPVHDHVRPHHAAGRSCELPGGS